MRIVNSRVDTEFSGFIKQQFKPTCLLFSVVSRGLIVPSCMWLAYCLLSLRWLGELRRSQSKSKGTCLLLRTLTKRLSSPAAMQRHTQVLQYFRHTFQAIQTFKVGTSALLFGSTALTIITSNTLRIIRQLRANGTICCGCLL